MSLRHDIAKILALFIVENNIAQVFGGDVTKNPNNRSYDVGMSICRLMDGEIKVFAPTFILIKSWGPLGDNNQVFDSVENAMAYMKARWVDFNQDEAQRIPRKNPRKNS